MEMMQQLLRCVDWKGDADKKDLCTFCTTIDAQMANTESVAAIKQ